MKNKLLLFISHFAPARQRIMAFALAGGFLILNFEFAQSANYYWVGGTGNWSDYANHWATTSGGNIFQPHVPTSFDNVYFDANSFTANGQIVTADPTIAYCLDMNWTGAINNPVFQATNSNIQLKIYGSLTLDPSVNFSFSGALLFTSFNPGKTIQTFSKVLQCHIEFNGAGGEWTMLDSLTTTEYILLTYGTVRTNDNNINCFSFYSFNSNVRALYLGTSTVRMPTLALWQVSASLTIDADSSIICLGDGGEFEADGQVYNVIQWDSTHSSTSSFISNTLNASNLVINKILSFNSSEYSQLEFYYNDSIRIDTVIAKGLWWVHAGGSNYYNYIRVNHNVQVNAAEQDTIIKMIADEDITIGTGPSHFIHDLTVGGDLTIGVNLPGYPNSQTFDSCRVYGNASILSPNNYLGIFTMTPGNILTLKRDSTQYIDSLSATGNPGFPIQIVSSDLGYAANVFIQDGLCTDYLYIQAVHATSPNLLFVGTNSNDVANNSGWIFTNCGPTGIVENYNDEISLFPNPVSSELRIKNAEFRINELEVFDAFGQKIFIQQPSAKSQQLVINVSDFNPGIYFVKVRSNEEERIAKFMKE